MIHKIPIQKEFSVELENEGISNNDELNTEVVCVDVQEVEPRVLRSHVDDSLKEVIQSSGIENQNKESKDAMGAWYAMLLWGKIHDKSRKYGNQMYS